eukprot:scpid95595/ scgid32236/ 
MDDGSGYLDLTPISNNDGTAFFTNIAGDGGFSYNPCYSFQDNKCQNNVAVCQHGEVVCGQQSTAKFTITSTSPLQATIAYSNGDEQKGQPRVANVAISCDPTKDHDITFTSEAPGLTYNLALTSKYACLVPAPTSQTSTTGPRKPEGNALSLGTILDICAVAALLLYLSMGSAFMFVRREARGREVLPNYTFWVAIPGLVKE